MEQLGIEPKLLFAQIVNFTIIIVVLSKLLYKPILDILDKRKKEITDGLALTEKMRLEEEKLTQKRAKLADAARVEAQAIIAEARKKAKEAGDSIITQSQTEANAIFSKGKADIQAERGEMEKAIRGYATDLAVAMAKRLLSDSLTGEDKQKILEKHLKNLEEVRIPRS